MSSLDYKLKNINHSLSDAHTSSEYLLNPENGRLTIYPIQNKLIWDTYKKQQAAYWTAEEIDFSKDYKDFCSLNENEQYFIKLILAFFSSSDTIVNINLGERFLHDVKIREATTVYIWQMMIESTHAEVYSLQIENIIRDPIEKDKLFNHPYFESIEFLYVQVPAIIMSILNECVVSKVSDDIKIKII